ncbi:MAG: hypothetical protein LBN08_02040 [Lactobacillales bacterium]|jgi:hypothetical protein|nr:hypothetical protein [Lactobacillales bacterium]
MKKKINVLVMFVAVCGLTLAPCFGHGLIYKVPKFETPHETPKIFKFPKGRGIA